jgi:hypothetical protein
MADEQNYEALKEKAKQYEGLAAKLRQEFDEAFQKKNIGKIMKIYSRAESTIGDILLLRGEFSGEDDDGTIRHKLEENADSIANVVTYIQDKAKEVGMSLEDTTPKKNPGFCRARRTV